MSAVKKKSKKESQKEYLADQQAKRKFFLAFEEGQFTGEYLEAVEEVAGHDRLDWQPQLLLPFQHIEYLHLKGASNEQKYLYGIIASKRRPEKDGIEWAEKAYLTRELASMASKALAGINFYVSINLFFRPHRSLMTLGALTCFYVDLDFHKDPLNKYRHYDPADVAKLVQEKLEVKYGSEFSKHVAILFSGGGLCVQIAFNYVKRSALGKWQAVQYELYHTLKEFGADRAALDAAHVFRIAGTVNPNSHKLVRWFKKPDSDMQGDFDEICTIVFSKIIKKTKQNKQKRENKGNNQSKNCWFDRLTYYALMLDDLDKLMAQRFNGGLLSTKRTPPKITHGWRDIFAFIYCHALSYLIPIEEMEREFLMIGLAVGLNEAESRSFSSSLRKRAALSGVDENGVYQNYRYRYKAQTLVELLDIHDDEIYELDLRTLITDKVHKDRDAEGFTKRSTAWSQERKDREKKMKQIQHLRREVEAFYKQTITQEIDMLYADLFKDADRTTKAKLEEKQAKDYQDRLDKAVGLPAELSLEAQEAFLSSKLDSLRQQEKARQEDVLKAQEAVIRQEQLRAKEEAKATKKAAKIAQKEEQKQEKAQIKEETKAEKLALIISMKQEGKTLDAIAKALGVSKQAISKSIKNSF
jgi:hypothetical protein